jgi:hypothetical protein
VTAKIFIPVAPNPLLVLVYQYIANSGKWSRQFSHFLPLAGKPNQHLDKTLKGLDKLNLCEFSGL